MLSMTCKDVSIGCSNRSKSRATGERVICMCLPGLYTCVILKRRKYSVLQVCRLGGFSGWLGAREFGDQAEQNAAYIQ